MRRARSFRDNLQKYANEDGNQERVSRAILAPIEVDSQHREAKYSLDMGE